jgi:hypothetical protein
MERDIFEFIEIWYNKEKPSSDYKTIEEFWKQKNNFKMLLNYHCGFNLHIQLKVK